MLFKKFLPEAVASTLEKLREFHNMKKNMVILWSNHGKKWSIETPRKVSISILSLLNGVHIFAE